MQNTMKVGKYLVQTITTASLSCAYARYINNRFSVLRLPSIPSDTTAAVIGASVAGANILLHLVVSKTSKHVTMQYLGSIMLPGAALLTLAYTKKLIEITIRDAAIILAITSLTHLAFKLAQSAAQAGQGQPISIAPAPQQSGVVSDTTKILQLGSQISGQNQVIIGLKESIENLKELYRKDKEALQTQHEGEIDKLKSQNQVDHENAIKELEQTQKLALDKMEKGFQDKLKEATTKFGQADKKINELQQNFEEQKRILNTKTEEAKTLTQKIGELQKDNLTKQKAQLEKHKQAINSKAIEIDELNKHLTEKREAAQRASTDMVTERLRYNGIIDELNEKKRQLELELSHQEERIQQLLKTKEIELQNLKKEHEKTIRESQEQFEIQLQEKQTQLEQLSNTNSEQGQKLIELESKFNALTSERDALISKIATKKETLESLASELSNEREKFEKMQREHQQTLGTDSEKNASALEQQKNIVAEMEQQANSQKQDIDELTQKNRTNEQELNNLRAELERVRRVHEEAILEIRRKNEEEQNILKSSHRAILENTQKKSEQDLQEKQSQLDQLSNTNKQQEQNFSTLERTCNDLMSDKEQLNDQIKQKQNDLTYLEEQLSAEKGKLQLEHQQTLDIKAQELESQISKLNKDLEEEQRKLEKLNLNHTQLQNTHSLIEKENIGYKERIRLLVEEKKHLQSRLETDKALPPSGSGSISPHEENSAPSSRSNSGSGEEIQKTGVSTTNGFVLRTINEETFNEYEAGKPPKTPNPRVVAVQKTEQTQQPGTPEFNALHLGDLDSFFTSP